MITIKIKPSHPSQGDYVVINVSDFDPQKHEPFDQESRDALLEYAAESGHLNPSEPELQAMHDQLLVRQGQLDDRELQLNQRAGLLDAREQTLLEREMANATEAQRLADLAAAQAAQIDPASMTKAQLQAALTAKGVPFSSTADKAELLALLTGA
ncbi:hypothetical protein GTP44_03825 [Duganella sp. FT50W]|uniref:HeH/LEM domain-containing protein n=1 Tax=Duganella lactea TaxID=2692173 RepID=A0A6L8MFD2_9BURK|nr:hypothetical protein [Duganella lactea]MYM81089.1 hypothetical protein [Duganella lactea]